MIEGYYIYLHKTQDSGEVFYVGKGTRYKWKGFQRGYELKRRSKFWNSVVCKHGVVVEIVFETCSEKDAFSVEIDLIKKYGRRDIGTGSLVNMTNGGEGMSGHKQRPETIAKKIASMRGRVIPDDVRRKISQSLSGDRNPLYGKPRSDETKRRQSESGKGIRLGGKSPLAKKVVDVITGYTYASTRDAANAIGMNMFTLSHKLSGSRTNNTSLRYA